MIAAGKSEKQRCEEISRRAGPFDVTPRRASGLGDALVTGLLVVYPAFATVAAIVVCLVLSGGGA